MKRFANGSKGTVPFSLTRKLEQSPKGHLAVAGVILAAVALWPAPAQAMHIHEGGLPASWAGLWFLLAAPFLWWGLNTINRRREQDPAYMLMVAMVGAAIFVISCMPVPVPVAQSCSHPCGTGLGALLIGPGPTVVVASIALLLQALFLSHGGLTTLGANIMSMGVVGAIAHTCSTTFCDGCVCRLCRRLFWPAWYPTGPPTP